MADYLVLEEDGTSHLELEESTDDFLTEESGVVPPAPSVPRYHVGTLTVPSSTGTQVVRFDTSSYTDHDSGYTTYAELLTGEATYAGMVAGEPVGTPQAVIFFGTNWTTEDAAVTDTGLGMFRGMAAPKWDAPATIIENAASVVATPAGNAHHQHAYSVFQVGTSGSDDLVYAANLTSFDSNGFTLNFVVAGGGGHRVVYVALLDQAYVAARVGLFDGTTINLGFKAGACLLHGALQGPIASSNNSNQEFYGGGAYPTGSDLNWESCGVTIGCFPTSIASQSLNEVTRDTPHNRVATGMHFTGPSLVPSNIWAYPTGSPAAGNSFTIGGDPDDGGMVLVWDDEHNRTRENTPAATEDGTVTQTGLPFAPVLLIGYTISNEPPGSTTGGRGAIGMSVVAPGFQWCATVDGHSSQGSFQSFQRGFADAVSGTSVHAGTVELTSDGWILTTEEDDLAPSLVVWHAFGVPPAGAAWIPQIYRRILNT